MKTLTATPSKRNNGMWIFTCPLHGERAHEYREPSNATLAINTIKTHMDEHHPGVKARIQINGEYIVHTTYTATTVIQPKGDLL
jgi:hypothetical protein